MQEIKQKIQELVDRLQALKDAVDLPGKKKKIDELEFEAGKADLWSEPHQARKVTQELSDLKKEIAEIDELTQNLEIMEQLLTDENSLPELEKEVPQAEKSYQSWK